MVLKNPELFKSWLIHQLQPICNADPEAVSKYVMALVKKIQVNTIAKSTVVSDLEVFLNESSNSFVDTLYRAIDTAEYLKFSADDPDDLLTSILMDVQSPINFESMQSSPVQSPPESNKQIPNESANAMSDKEAPLKSDNEERERSSIMETRKISPQRRSLTSSSERKRWAKYSTERSSHSRRKERKRRRSCGFDSSSSSECSSPPRRLRPSKHHSSFSRFDDNYANERDTRSSYHRYKKRNKDYQSASRNSTRSGDVNYVSPYKRNRGDSFMSRSDFSVKHPTLKERHGFIRKDRCIDYEERGICVRGDYCPYDHGRDCMVLGNASGMSSGLPYPMQQPLLMSSYDSGMMVNNEYNVGTLPPAPPILYQNSQHNHSNYDTPLNSASGFQYPAGNQPRELITIPTGAPDDVNKVECQSSYQLKNEVTKSKEHQVDEFSRKTRGHIYSSSNPGISQATVEVTNIPVELNSIPYLYDCFSQFGTITLVQTCRGGNRNTALITFSNATQASFAYNSGGKNAMPGIDLKVSWFTDECLLQPYSKKVIPATSKNFRSASASSSLPTSPSIILPVSNFQKSTVQAGVQPLVSVASTNQASNVYSTSYIWKSFPPVTSNLKKKAQASFELLTKRRNLLKKLLNCKTDVLKTVSLSKKEDKATYMETLMSLQKQINDAKIHIANDELREKEFLETHKFPSMEYVLSYDVDKTEIASVTRASVSSPLTQAMPLDPSLTRSNSSVACTLARSSTRTIPSTMTTLSATSPNFVPPTGIFAQVKTPVSSARTVVLPTRSAASEARTIANTPRNSVTSESHTVVNNPRKSVPSSSDTIVYPSTISSPSATFSSSHCPKMSFPSRTTSHSSETSTISNVLPTKPESRKTKLGASSNLVPVSCNDRLNSVTNTIMKETQQSQAPVGRSLDINDDEVETMECEFDTHNDVNFMSDEEDWDNANNGNRQKDAGVSGYRSTSSKEHNFTMTEEEDLDSFLTGGNLAKKD